MTYEEETTTQSRLRDLAHPSLELHLLLADGGERWVQFEHSQFTLAGHFPEGSLHRFRLEGEAVIYQGGEAKETTLKVGDCLQIKEHRIWLMDARLPEVARLETCPGPEAAQTWSLKPQAYRLGRRGQSRLNHIELSHPTVSRAQATLMPFPSGRFGVLAESTSSPTRLNGVPIPVGQVHSLHHGDLLQLGEVSLRFRHSGQGSVPLRRLRVRSLGGFALQWGQASEVGWKSNKARLLMARLALAWDQPLATEYLMELLWPDLPPLRGRKNLSQCLSELKASLGVEEEAELLLRNPATLQLKPEILDEHDVTAFRELAAGSHAEGWIQAIHLYQGAYLPELGEDWVALVRQELQVMALAACQKLTHHWLTSGQFEEAMAVAARGLNWEPCHQILAQHSMEAALHSQRPEEAIRCYECIRAQLHKTFAIEPNTELMRLHLAARGQL